MKLTITAAAALLLCTAAATSAAPTRPADCSPVERTHREQALVAFDRKAPRRAKDRRQRARRQALVRALAACNAHPPLPSTPPPLTFWPQAGILGQDLYVANFVDLDPGPAVRDWNCGTRSYDGHTGIDVTIRGFPEQEMGVPVFAAADGLG